MIFFCVYLRFCPSIKFVLIFFYKTMVVFCFNWLARFNFYSSCQAVVFPSF
ncbi:hypothetical protein Hanom_Chr15g01341321 [Helianthus anomalus]